jgi:hypothetical protein
MTKTEVYSWRLSPALKSRLEEAARSEEKSLAELLDSIARDWLTGSQSADGEAEQRTLHEAANRLAGSVELDDPDLSTRVRERVRAKLRRRGSG